MVFDVDSTLIEDEAIELLAEKAGTREQVAQITDRAMRGELDFAESLRERVSTLAGLPESTLLETSRLLRPTKGAKELISAVHAKSGVVAAVSGGFIQLLEPIQSSLQLDYVHANTLEVKSGLLTGRVSGQIIDRAQKAVFLRELAEKLSVPIERTIAVGDGANDIDMLSQAGLGIAFCAKPKLIEVADLVLNERDLELLVSVLP